MYLFFVKHLFAISHFASVKISSRTFSFFLFDKLSIRFKYLRSHTSRRDVGETAASGESIVGTRYFRNWFREANGNDDFRLPTKAKGRRLKYDDDRHKPVERKKKGRRRRERKDRKNEKEERERMKMRETSVVCVCVCVRQRKDTISHRGRSLRNIRHKTNASHHLYTHFLENTIADNKFIHSFSLFNPALIFPVYIYPDVSFLEMVIHKLHLCEIKSTQKYNLFSTSLWYLYNSLLY